jgi:cytochrome c-type biogenesis protein CcmH/NrfG
VIVVILVVVLSPAAFRTALRTHDLRDHATFVEATAAASPRAVKALVNVGRSRMRSGRVSEAVDPLEQAVTLWPDYRRALGLLAEAWSQLGDAETAAEYRERAEAAAERARMAGGPPPP